MRDAASSGLVLAPVALRVLAVLIDFLILVAVSLAVAGSFDDVELRRRETYAIMLVAWALYHIGFLVLKSATPGKMAMGLYVGDAEARPLTPDKAILRYMVYFIGGSVLGVGTLVSVVLILVDPKHRALHDRIAGTLVLFGRPEAGSGRPS